MRQVEMPSGVLLPVVGLGTWEMGARLSHRAAEVAALQLGIELGATLVDTAEMYARGGAEEVVGIALRGRRDRVFVTSKVLPENASRAGTVRAAERSLKRLGTDRIDLYLLHWPGDHPLEETFAGFEVLQRAGKILSFGVSNFDVQAMEEARALPGGASVAADQIYYNLRHRGIERRLLPWCRERGVLLMAYSPLDQGRLPERAALRAVAARHGVTPVQIALAWTIRSPGIVTIPKAGTLQHVRDDVAAAAIELSAPDLEELEAAYPPPPADVPLETL